MDIRGDKKIERSFVAEDQIWKDYVHTETNVRLYQWPANWGFLVDEYDKLSATLSGGASTTRKEMDMPSAAYPLRLPPIQKGKTKRIVPETIYGLYGWRQGKDPAYKHIHEIEKQARPKCTITKVFKWPVLYV